MRPAVALSTYAAALALVFATAFGVGRAVGPVGTVAAEPPSGTAEAPAEMPVHGDDEADHPSP